MVEAAADVAKILHRTPAVAPDQRLLSALFRSCENLWRTGAFEVREVPAALRRRGVDA